MMGFGFVVARFGLFLRELARVGGMAPIPHTGWSLGMGTALVLVGVAATLLAAVQHVRFLLRLNRGEPYRPPRWSFGVIVSVVLARGSARDGRLPDRLVSAADGAFSGPAWAPAMPGRPAGRHFSCGGLRQPTRDLRRYIRPLCPSTRTFIP